MGGSPTEQTCSPVGIPGVLSQDLVAQDSLSSLRIGNGDVRVAIKTAFDDPSLEGRLSKNFVQ